LRESLNVAQDTGALAKCDMEVVTVDTTVQEKSVRFPTDAALLYTALTKLGIAARTSVIKLRQSYVRVGKRAQIMAGRYAHARQYKRMRKQLKFLKTRLGRMVRDVERNIEGNPEKQAAFAGSLQKARIIGGQALSRRAKPKIYSWHAPEVECIGKGKARAPYEFGCKATITNGRAKGGMFILQADALHGNPFDRHTLARCWNRPPLSPVSRRNGPMLTKDTGATSRTCTCPIQLPVCPRAYHGGYSSQDEKP
jgi:IS5 family transposase